MKKLFLLLVIACASMASYAQEVSPETLAKRSLRKNLIVKEFNTDSRGKSQWLDHITVYDDQGRKIEETEYSTYGQVERVATEYGENGLVSREIVYDNHNKPCRIRKYEYNADGTRKRQYNYLPNGKLYSIKEFQYEFSNADQKGTVK